MATFEITDEVVTGHQLATRWGVRSYMLREIARAILPEGATKGYRDRFNLGQQEQEALARVMETIDRERVQMASGGATGHR
jgi:hypothetical protein